MQSEYHVLSLNHQDADYSPAQTGQLQVQTGSCLPVHRKMS